MNKSMHQNVSEHKNRVWNFTAVKYSLRKYSKFILC